MPSEESGSTPEGVSRITLYWWVKAVSILFVVLLAFSIFAASSPSYQYSRHPLLEVSWALFILGILWNAVVFTTWYQVDSTGIHKHSYFTKRKEIRWEDVTLVSSGKNDAIIIVSDRVRFEFNPQMYSGLPHLSAYLKAKVLDYDMMEAEKQVDSFSEDYDKIKTGTPERWINFKYYSPLLAFYIMYSGFMALEAPFTGEVPWNGASIGVAITIPVIAGLFFYLRRKHTQ